MAFSLTSSFEATGKMLGFHPFMQESFGKFLKSYRQQAGLTQEELGKRCGKSQTAISDYEHDRRTIDRSDAKPISVALGLSEAVVLEAAGFRTAETSSDPEVYRLESGRRVLIVSREGEPGTPLDLDEQSLAILEALAKSKPLAKKSQ